MSSVLEVMPVHANVDDIGGGEGEKQTVKAVKEFAVSPLSISLCHELIRNQNWTDESRLIEIYFSPLPLFDKM